jgi:hypothetical protein
MYPWWIGAEDDRFDRTKRKRDPPHTRGLSVIPSELLGPCYIARHFLFYFFPFSTFFSLDPGDKEEDFFFLFAQQEKKRRNSARALLNFKIKTYRKLLRIGRERS